MLRHTEADAAIDAAMNRIIDEPTTDTRMKNRFQTQLKVWGTLSVAVILSLLPGNVQAVQQPPERSLVGVVESVDINSSSLTVKTQGKSPTTLKLGLRTQTVVRAGDGKRTNRDSITTGKTIEVRYRTHLLGIPQASRIVVK